MRKSPNPVRGGLFIAEDHTPIFFFLFFGGATEAISRPKLPSQPSSKSLRSLHFRAAEKQNKKRLSAPSCYKHATPTGFGSRKQKVIKALLKDGVMPSPAERVDTKPLWPNAISLGKKQE